eukprot:TRINITY_DN428_c0_g1_i2.p1 TRINITY_DN428_c0_g1~~TRINITY_DN428_c0_g1_i2.p1  ORF type:complete len:332 (-),score=79.57 TRINITY_DN428_c0_g1_i2:426-1421(-)
MHEPQDTKPRSPSPRVDVKQLKDRLFAALKENATQYWATLKRFLLAKLSKKELETYARQVLGDENLWLHNAFLRSILFNARHAAPPPTLPLALQTPRPPPKPRKRLSVISSPPSIPLSGPLSSIEPKQKQKVKRKNESSRPVPKPDKKAKTIDKNKKSANAPFSHKPGVFPLSTPDLVTLRGRMVKICTESGLRGLADDAVTLMMLALEQHIKDILRGCHPHYRPHPPPPSHRRPPLPHEGISAGDILNIHQLIGIQHPSSQNTLLTPPLTNTAVSSNNSSLSSSSTTPPSILATNALSLTPYNGKKKKKHTTFHFFIIFCTHVSQIIQAI